MVNKRKLKVDGKTIGAIEQFLNDNGPSVAIFGAVVLLAGSLYAAFRASGEVAKIKDEYDGKMQENAAEELSEPQKAIVAKDLRNERNIKYILAYKWALICGGSSVALMILSNVLSGAKIAGLTTAAALSQDKIKKLVENGKKIVGEEKWKDVEDKSLEDLVMQNFVTEDGRVALKPDLSAGDIFLDTDTGALIQINKQDLLAAIDHAEDYCNRNHGLYRDKWFEMLGVEYPTGSKVWCWGPKRPFKAWLGTRTICGMVVGSIEYEESPTSAWDAGIPGAKQYR